MNCICGHQVHGARCEVKTPNKFVCGCVSGINDYYAWQYQIEEQP